MKFSWKKTILIFPRVHNLDRVTSTISDSTCILTPWNLCKSSNSPLSTPRVLNQPIIEAIGISPETNYKEGMIYSRPSAFVCTRIDTILIREKIISYRKHDCHRPLEAEGSLKLFLILWLHLIVPIISHNLYSIHCVIKNAFAGAWGFNHEWVIFLCRNSTRQSIILKDMSWSQSFSLRFSQAIQRLLGTKSLCWIRVLNLIMLFNTWNSSMNLSESLESLISYRTLDPLCPVVPAFFSNWIVCVEYWGSLWTSILASIKVDRIFK